MIDCLKQKSTKPKQDKMLFHFFSEKNKHYFTYIYFELCRHEFVNIQTNLLIQCPQKEQILHEIVEWAEN